MPRRPHLRNLACACVLAAGLTGVGGCGSQSSVSGPPGARLIVLPEPTRDGMFSLVSGTLGINDQGCFTLDDRVLVVGNGSRVLEDEESIEVADVGVVEVGSDTSGGGGLIDGLEDVEYFAEAVGLGDEAMTCQSDVEEPALTVLDPSGP